MKWTVLFMLCAALSLAQLVGCGDEESASPWVTVTVLAEPQVKAELEHVQVLRADTSVTFWLRNPPQGREPSSFPLSFDLRGEGAGQIDIVGYAEGAERIRRTLALPRVPKGRSFLTVMLRDDCLGSRVQCTSGFSCGGCEPEARCVPIDVSDQLGRRPTIAEMCVGEGSDGGPGWDGGDGDGGSEDASDGAQGGGDSAMGTGDGGSGDSGPAGGASSKGAPRPLAAGRCAGIDVPRPEGDSARAPWSVSVEGRPGTLASDPKCENALAEVSFDAGSSSRALYFRPDPLPAGQHMGESKLVLSRGGAQSEIALEVRRAAVRVDAGTQWACALLDDASVQCWGAGWAGQLAHPKGVSAVPLRAQATPVGISTSTRLVASAEAMYALTDGKLSAWGANGEGHLGVGSIFYGSHVPQQPTGMQSGVTDVAGGWNHACAVKDGDAYCWGANAWGLVGGEQELVLTPRKVSELEPGLVEEVATGWDSSCARLSDGAVKCWGMGAGGRLGNGDTQNSKQPVAVLLPGPATRIWAGAETACALVEGDLYCWGEEVLLPAPVDAPTPIEDMVLLDDVLCVLSAGDLYCRGDNTQGLLGTGATSQQVTNFQRVPLPAKVAQVAHHALMAICDGVVYGWGFDGGPTLGLSPLAGPVLSPTPTRLFDGLDVDSVTFGREFGCARARSDGQVLCWGSERNGALGQGDVAFRNAVLNKPRPVVVLPKGVDALSAHDYHVLALRDGQAYGWGANYYGQLGRGVTDQGSGATPTPVTVLPAGAKVARVVAGNAHACALVRDSGEDDGVYCWGAYDTVGGGTKAKRFYAADAGVTDLASGGDFVCAVVKGGVECWGDVPDSMTPVPVTGLEPGSGKGVVNVEVGDTYACARSSENAVWCWTRALTAASFSIKASALAVGTYAACAIDLADELWCWNGPSWDQGNALGQLGTGDTAVRYVPTKVASLKAPVTHVSIMQDTVLARDAEGYKCWGDQSGRRCGLTPWIVSTPTPVFGWDVN